MELDKDSAAELMRIKARESRYKNEAEAKISDLENRLAEAQTALDNNEKMLEEALTKDQELEKEIQRLETIINEANEKALVLENENRLLREANDKEIQTKDSMLAEIESLKQENQKATAIQDELKNKLACAVSQQNENESYKNIRETYQNQINTLKKENEKYLSRINEYRNELKKSSHADISDEIAELERIRQIIAKQDDSIKKLLQMEHFDYKNLFLFISKCFIRYDLLSLWRNMRKLFYENKGLDVQNIKELLDYILYINNKYINTNYLKRYELAPHTELKKPAFNQWVIPQPYNKIGALHSVEVIETIFPGISTNIPASSNPNDIDINNSILIPPYVTVKD